MKLPNGETSELTYSDSVVRRVVCMDETDHPFTTKMIDVVVVRLVMGLTKMIGKEEEI